MTAAVIELATRRGEPAPCRCWLCDLKTVQARLRALEQDGLLVAQSDLDELRNTLREAIRDATRYVNRVEKEHDHR